MNHDSPAWVIYTYISFGVALFMNVAGIFFLPAEIWIKAYLCMAAFFLVGTTFTLAKTVRDSHESQKLHNRIDEAKTERLLNDIEAA